MKSEVIKLADLVQYQDGTIVSKMLVNRATGTVTAFAFDKDQMLSEHTAPFDALLQVIEGKAEIIISNKKHDLTAGEMIIMPANEPHAVKATKKFKMLLYMIKS